MELTGRLFDTQIAREATKILFDNLNDKMTEMESEWDSEDEDFLLYMNRGIRDWNWEPVEDENFHEGVMPGIITAPPDRFPCVMVVCHDATPSNSSDDTGELYNFLMDIELIAKSGSFSEEYNFDCANQVKNRLQRLKEATILVMLENRSINNSVVEINAPRVTTGDIFTRREKTGKYYYQGCSIRYNVNKYLRML